MQTVICGISPAPKESAEPAAVQSEGGQPVDGATIRAAQLNLTATKNEPSPIGTRKNPEREEDDGEPGEITSHDPSSWIAKRRAGRGSTVVVMRVAPGPQPSRTSVRPGRSLRRPARRGRAIIGRGIVGIGVHEHEVLTDPETTRASCADSILDDDGEYMSFISTSQGNRLAVERDPGCDGRQSRRNAGKTILMRQDRARTSGQSQNQDCADSDARPAPETERRRQCPARDRSHMSRFSPMR